MTVEQNRPELHWPKLLVGAAALILTVAAIGGFIVFPLLQPGAGFTGLWDAICSASGFAVKSSAGDQQPSDSRNTQVTLASALPEPATPEAIGRGATIAQQCAICHGPTGISRADAPNLSGQYAISIYKQLMDFKTGARVNAIMSPFAMPLSNQNMADVSSYYAYLPRFKNSIVSQGSQAPRIVMNGEPLRGIAPCGACHGALDNKAGSPWLEGQPYAYIKAQLHAFASSVRRNDISGQMRNIARSMTPEEIEEAARYYAGQPANVPLK